MPTELKFNPEDGTVWYTDGTVTPKGSRVVQNNRDHIVVKEPGHNYNSGLNQTVYAETQFRVFFVECDKAGEYGGMGNPPISDLFVSGYDGRVLFVRECIHFPARIK